MNPPFTRDSLRYDQFSIADELAVKRREIELIKDLAYRAAARLSGSANSFMVLAEQLLNDDKATLELYCQLP